MMSNTFAGLSPSTSLHVLNVLVRNRPGGTPLLRAGKCMHMAPLRAEPLLLHPRLAGGQTAITGPGGEGGNASGGVSYYVCCAFLTAYPVACILSPPCLFYVHLSLTSLAGSYAC